MYVNISTNNTFDELQFCWRCVPKGTVLNLLHRQMPLLIAQLDKSIVKLGKVADNVEIDNLGFFYLLYFYFNPVFHI